MARDEAKLLSILLDSPAVATILYALPGMGLPHAYLAAGCVAQTVWNSLWGFPPTHGIDDADIIYFDGRYLTEAGEQAAAQRAARHLPGTPFRLDVKNEARVHLWYPDKFGYPIAPYESCEAAIRSFPTTATAVGIRPRSGGLSVYAPFGLADLLGGVVRPNKVQITEAIYRRKVDKWRAKWPSLQVEPW